MKQRNTAHLFVMPCTIWLAIHCFIYVLHLVILLKYFSFLFPFISALVCVPLAHFLCVYNWYRMAVYTFLLTSTQNVWRIHCIEGIKTERERERAEKMLKIVAVCKCKFTLNDETNKHLLSNRHRCIRCDCFISASFYGQNGVICNNKRQHDIT